jgi:DNA topoisomerase VI subunit B
LAKITAHELAKKQKEISVAEFFERNKHILGFGNLTRALLTSIKEGVDNALDACEEADILPDIYVEIQNHEVHVKRQTFFQTSMSKSKTMKMKNAKLSLKITVQVL